MTAGRPTDYRPEYCEAVIGYMAEGKSLTSFAASINAARSTITQWMGAHPEFMAAAHVGKAKCAAWWEDRGRELAQDGGSGAQATMCVFGLKNMSPEDWRDKQSVEHSGPNGGPLETVELSPTEYKARIAGRLAAATATLSAFEESDA